MNQIKTKVNPCPLCGHVGNVLQEWGSKFQVECIFCGVRSSDFSKLDETINDWNSQSKKKYTQAEKKRQKLVSAGQNLGRHLWDYNFKGTLVQLEDNK